MSEYCALPVTGAGAIAAPAMLVALLLIVTGGVVLLLRTGARRAAKIAGVAALGVLLAVSGSGLGAAAPALAADGAVACEIVAVDDVFGDFAAGAGGTTPSVLINDTVDEQPATTGNVTVTANGVLPAGFTLNADGTIAIATSVAAGSYQVPYRICATTDPVLCDTAVATVTVTAASPPPVVVAVDDAFGGVDAGTGGVTATVITNDTVDGSAATTANVTVTANGSLPAGFTLNADGTITVAASVPGGVYAVPYQICATALPAVCDTAVATITVTTTIDAVDDSYGSDTPLNGVTGTMTASVLANDLLNGGQATTGNVTVSAVGALPTGLTLNADGTITVAPLTAAGTYPVTYEICAIADPAVCDTAVATVVVGRPDMAMTSIAFSGQTIQVGQPVTVTYTITNIGSVATSGPITFTALKPTSGTATFVASPPPAGWTVSGVANQVFTSSTSLAPGQAVSFEVIYTLTGGSTTGNVIGFTGRITSGSGGEQNTANNIKTVSLRVGASIDAVDDSYGSDTPLNGATGTTTASVLANDLLNGGQATTGTVTVEAVGALPAGLTLNADGTITVAPLTAAGTYPVTYEICAIADPAVCDTAVATVLVARPDMEATSIAVSGQTIQIGQPVTVTYTITNIGSVATSGLITFTAMKPSGSNTFVASTPPAGWSVSAATSPVFTTSNSLAPGETVSFDVVYTQTSGAAGSLVPFIGRITNGSGGEVNTANNVKSRVILFN